MNKFKKWRIKRKFTRKCRIVKKACKEIEFMMDISGYTRQARRNFWAKFWKEDKEKAFNIFYS